MTARSYRRREDPRLITGKGRYVADLVEADDLHIHFHRSPIAHGILTGVDVETAASASGVRLVITGADIDLPPIPSGPLVEGGFERPLLASGKVRYVGDPIAAVIADTAAHAADGSELVWADIDPLPVVVDPRSSISGEPLFEDGNVTAHRVIGGLSDREYPVSATVSVRNQRLAPAAIEGLAIRAVPTSEGGLVVQVGHQAPHRFRGQLAVQLRIEADLIRVIVPDVGGAFGMKGMLFPEYIVTCAAAIRLGEPVVWVEERREHFASGVHGRSQDHVVTLEGDTDGTIRRGRIEILADIGAYPHAGSLVPNVSAFVAQGLYDLEELRVEMTNVVTNRAPTGSYRGAGRPEAAYAMERAVDGFARVAGVDPIEVRRKSLIAAESLPYKTHTGAIYDSGDYHAALETALDLIDLAWVKEEQAKRLEEGLDPIGIGVGAFVERSGGALGSGEFGQVEVADDGKVVVRTGSTASGQGQETVWAQVAADVFDVPAEEVVVIAGDTGEVEDGVGTYGSRSAQIGASAVHRTSLVVVEQAKNVAAVALEANAADLVVGSGRVHVVGDPESGLSLSEVARLAGDAGTPLQSAEMFIPDAQAFPFGVHVAVVEVLLETGEVKVLRFAAVDDCGVVLNPMIVDGQVVGSLAQGFGQALLEGMEFSDAGDPLTSTFMDYLIPAAMDVPEFTLGRTVSPATSNPLGVKGTGESGCIGAPPAIVNATLDALAPYGVRDLSMPLRPHKVWAAIQEASR